MTTIDAPRTSPPYGARHIDDLNMICSGQGGDGSLTVTTVLADLLRRDGLHVYTERDVLSRIKGGYAAASLRASAPERHAMGDHLEVVVAFEEQGVRRAIPRLAHDAVVVFDSSEGNLPEGLLPDGARLLAAPMGRYAVRDLGRTLYKNMIATGIVTRALGIPDDEVRDALRTRFKRLGQPILGYNLQALDLGFGAAEDLQVGEGLYNVTQTHGSERIQLTGNEALAFGFLVAGGRFFTGYPITPATDILDWLQKWLPQFGGIARQAEDELAAINMAIGAALTGVRSMTGTSGPGLALMQEGVSQAGSGEIPLVIVDTQRSGPSTGMPTKPEQSDINLMCFGGNGDFPRIVVAPGSVQDCFEIGIQATNLAEQFQIPVYVAMDQGTCQNLATIEPFDLDHIEIDRGKRLTQKQVDALGRYDRYAITSDGVSPYTVPGTAHGMSLVTGNERYPDGTVTTNPGNRRVMVAKRDRKLETAVRGGHLPTSVLWGDAEAEIGVIGVGGAFGPILEALERLEARGIAVAYHQPRTIWPVPRDTVEFINSRRRVFVAELNAAAQLAKLFIREGADAAKIQHVLRFDGEPMRPNDIVGPIASYCEEQ